MPSKLNGPNALTLLRIAMVPLFIWLLFAEYNRWLVLVAFLLAALTDLLDGWWAREAGLITNWGKIADPIADKALTGAAWIGLSMLGELAWLATGLILVREVGITLLRLRIADRLVVAANAGGKLKTTLQIVVISVLLVAPTMFPLLPDWADTLLGIALQLLVWITVAVTAVTGYAYVLAIAKVRGGER